MVQRGSSHGQARDDVDRTLELRRFVEKEVGAGPVMALSRIPVRPIDRPVEASSAVIPTPSSRTSRTRSAPHCSSVTATRDARLCRATLVSAS
jgi:hypothetical protein